MESAPSPVPGSPEWWAREIPPAAGRGRPAVAMERIVDAGLELLDRADGPEYSIRNVAQLLGSSTATLYRRVEGRPGLDALIVDRVLGEAVGEPADSSGLSWQDAVLAGAEAIFAALARHPRVVALLAARVPNGPNSALLRERSVSRLLAEGFAPALAARTYTTVAHYTVGFALQLALESSADGTAPSRSEAGRLPATARVAAHLDSDLHDEFVFGLTMLLDGIAASRA